MDPDNLPKFVYLHKNHKFRLKLGFYAAPSNPKIFSKSVRDELDNSKFTYCSDLNGLVMGFGKISSCEVIQADTRNCISVAVYVDVFIFRPPVGSIIEAVVNQISSNHVSCLVHKLFNISIVRPENQPYDQWSGSKIKKDDKINVKVLSFDLTKKLPHITGDIVDNEINEFNNSHNENNCSAKYSSSSEESESYFSKSIKHIENKVTSTSSSESSDEYNSTMIHSKKISNTFIEAPSLPTQTTIQINNHIRSPLGSSTPVSSSEHSVKNINAIRNKQLEQLQKHLAKNSAEKLKNLESNDKYVINKLSQSSNINNNVSNLPAATIDGNSNIRNKINKHCNLQSDSGISGDELRQIQDSSQNSFLNTSKESLNKTNEYKNSDTIFSASVQSAQSPEKNKPETNVVVDSSLNTSSSDEENSVFTQRINDINNLDEKNLVFTQQSCDMMSLETLNENKLDESKSLNKSKNRQSTIKLSTKSIQKNNSPSKKSLKDCKNLTEEKIVKTPLSDVLSDLENSRDDDMILPIKKNIGYKDKTKTVSPGSKINITNNQYTSSSDDEIYTKLRQNTSKIKDTKSLADKTMSKTFHEISSSDNESVLSSKFLHDISSTNLTKSNATKLNSVNKLQTGKCHINSDNNLLSNKQLSKKEKKIKELNEQSTDLQSKKNSNENTLLPNLIGEKIDTTKDILKEDSNSDDEVKNKFVKSNDGCKLMESKLSSKLPTSSFSKLDESTHTVLSKSTSNPFLRFYARNSSSSSSDDEIFINAPKSKELNQSSKKIDSPLIKRKENDKAILIKQVLTSIKHKDKTLEHKLPATHVSKNSDSSKDSNKLNKSKELKKEKAKYKKRITKEITNFEDPKPNLSIQNIVQKNSMLRIETQPSSDESSDEVDLIKKMIEKQNLKKTKNNDVLELIRQSETSSKLNNKSKYNLINNISKNSNSFVDSIKLNKSKILKKEKSNIKNKKVANLEDIKPNLSIQNISQKDSTLRIETQPSSDESSDEVDLIKKIIEKQNLKKTKNTDVPELFMQSETSSKLSNKSKDYLISNVSQNSFKDSIKLNKSKKCKKVKDKKGVSTKLTNFKDSKSNSSSQNISQKYNMLQLETQTSSDESNDEIDLIKKILEKKQNVIKTKKANEPEKLIIQSETSNKLNDKSKDNLIYVCNNSNSYENSDKLNISKKLKKEKTKVKNKSGISKKLTKFEDPKLNLATFNDNVLQSETHSTSGESNDEVDFIKKLLKKQNIKKAKKTDVPELNMLSNIPTKMSTQIETSTKLNNKSKTLKASKDHLSDVTKKLFCDSANEDSSIDHAPPKKKKKETHSFMIETNDNSKIISDHVNSTKIKKKKKKKKHDKPIEELNLNKSSVKANKIKHNDVSVKQQNVLIEEKNTDISGKKEKKKKAERIEERNPIQDHVQYMQTDKLINRIVKNSKKPGSSKKKKNDLLKSKIKQIQLSQDDTFIKELNNLYQSFNQNDKN